MYERLTELGADVKYTQTDYFADGSPFQGLVRQKGLEPLAHCLEGSCSIQLSYWREFDWSR